MFPVIGGLAGLRVRLAGGQRKGHQPMGFGPIARATLEVSDPAPEGAPQITLTAVEGGFQYAVVNDTSPDVVGSVLVYIEQNPDGTDPTDGLDFDSIRELEGASEIVLAGGPGEAKEGTETWPGGYEDGETAIFVCASTDDESDLES